MDAFLPDIDYSLYLLALFTGALLAHFSRFLGMIILFTAAGLLTYATWGSFLGKFIFIVSFIYMVGELRRY